MKQFCFSIFLMLLSLFAVAQPARMDLQGEWQFAFGSEGDDEAYVSQPFPASILLPGTTDTNQKGVKNTTTTETTHLTRWYPYEGKAWYKKTVEIPHSWKGRYVQLLLERTKPTKVWVDGRYVGHSDDISTAQCYDLSKYLAPGRHEITVMVDNGRNSVPPQLIDNSHAYTESTQTNWNGIIGDIALEARPVAHIQSVRIFPDAENKLVRVEIRMASPEKLGKKASVSLKAEAWNTSTPHAVASETFKLNRSRTVDTLTYKLGTDVQLWSEFSPALYRLTVELNNGDKQTVDFGLREFKAKGTQFTINGTTTFLRGKHDACVFPLTAHTAMDVATWRHYFQVAKSYGINHYRFHSWCPPEACFEAADIEGVYLQAELPFWGSMDKDDSRLLSFLEKEGLNLQRAYGNHASFVMFALGNELWGDQPTMRAMVDRFRKADNRLLYAYGSNNSLGFNGHTEGEDFLVTCRIGGEAPGTYTTHTRASFSFADAYEGGLLNHSYPNTVMNFSQAIANCPVPVVGHETGQYQIYPDYRQISKYTGVLYPWNLQTFRKRLEKVGMGNQAHDFFLASGKWAVELYRADIEMNLRTPGFAGFQLLDLQDYPGQGSAYVGILDAFMDSKGLITPEEWRQFCSPVVPLLELEKLCWTSNEKLKGVIAIAAYAAEPLSKGSVSWTLRSASDGSIVDRGSLPFAGGGNGLLNVGDISPDLSIVTKAAQLNLTVRIDGTSYVNTYRIWVYPDNDKIESKATIRTVCGDLDASAMKSLDGGEKVLWFPDTAAYKGKTVGGLVQTDYWNYRMFRTICENAKKPVSPGTMGLLLNPEHPLFAGFPTSFHTDWQWFAIAKASNPFILDNMPEGYRPIVQVIDNVERNHKLGLLFELAVGKGRLMVCMADLQSVADKPEVRRFYNSILDYMDSDAFNPQTKISNAAALLDLMKASQQADKIDTLHNISYD